LFLKANERVISLVRLMQADMIARGDDQLALNHELERSGLMRVDGHLPSLAFGYFFTKAPFLRVVLGSPEVFLRKCKVTSTAVTVHCPLDKVAETKIREFKKNNLWLLDANFDPIQPNN